MTGVAEILLHDWRLWMRGVGLAKRTVEERAQLLGRFARHMGGNPAEADWQAVAAFMDNPEWQPATRCTHFAHLRAWFAWLILMDHRVDDPTRKLRAPKRPRANPRPITLEQLEQLLRTPHHARTTVMLLLGAYQGLRVSEIAKFRGEDIAGDQVHVIGKGQTDEWIPLHELVAECAEVMPRRGWWFPSHVLTGEPIKGQSVSAMISKLMTRAGVPGTPHCLRHFYGTESLRSSGGNLELVRGLMRHASVATTAMYTKVDDRERRLAVAGMPQPARSALRAA